MDNRAKRMHRGALVDGRFEIVARAGAGGMGAVFRARDAQSGETVALKVLRDPTGDVARFMHEARVLAGIAHPHVVRYVAHGIGPAGDPYLAMEWVEGESLDARLRSGGLSIEETLVLARGVASALAWAHTRGIVHRDLKPSNLMLPHGSIEAVKLLDFGIARLASVTTPMTASGSILGTPGYMAPEQARGERTIGPAADVFSLGCVLFECITGKPAFQGTHPMALLAKLLFEEPPSLGEARPGVPVGIERLVGRMLAKAQEARIADGEALFEELGRLDRATGPAPSRREAGSAVALTSSEQRLLSIVLVGAPVMEAARATDATAPSGLPREVLAAMHEALSPAGARIEALPDGTVIGVLASAGSPTDQAAQGARSALGLRALLEELPIALVMGRSEAGARLPVGDTLERAVVLLHDARKERSNASVVIDELTRAFVEASFEVVQAEKVILLRRERLLAEAPRLLLGKPTPFVGRERVLDNLVGIVEEAVEERRAIATVVTGPAGMGKTRLRQELVCAVGKRIPGLAIGLGRADVMGSSAPFSLLSSLMSRSFGFEHGEPLSSRRDKLRSGVERFAAGDDAARIARFLGEMIGVPFPDEDDLRLRVARNDPKIMAEQIEAAYLDFNRCVLRRHPVLLVLEDLHWGDAASVRLVDLALRELEEQPFVVLAFARPEVHERQPLLWNGRSMQEMRLLPLSRRASLDLLRAALGPGVPEERAALLVERAGGNAFYLEEMIRAHAEGRGEGLPETVIGMVEARLGALPAEVRRALRAASIFGETCRKSGVLALLGEDVRTRQGNEIFTTLVDKELLTRSDKPRGAGEEEYAFRHALVREAAYAMLTERDRALGHKLAGDWLEAAGEGSPAILATHFERGGDPQKAAVYFTRAAEQALAGGEYEAALSMVERAFAAGAEGELVTTALSIRSAAAHWVGNYQLSIEAGLEATRRGPLNGLHIGQAMTTALQSAFSLRREDALWEILPRLFQMEPTPGHVGPLALCFTIVVVSLEVAGQLEVAAPFFDRLIEVCGPFAEQEPEVAMSIARARAHRAHRVERDPWRGLVHERTGMAATERMGHEPQQHLSRAFLTAALVDLGAYDEADSIVRVAVRARRGTWPFLMALQAQALLSVARGDSNATTAATAALEECVRQGDVMVGLSSRLVLVEAHIDAGELDSANSMLEEARNAGLPVSFVDHWTRALQALIDLHTGRASDALRSAEEAIAIAKSGRVYSPGYDLAILTRIEALLALGEHDRARAAIAEAHADLLARAAKIEDPAYRKTFLENVRENARLIELAGLHAAPTA